MSISCKGLKPDYEYELFAKGFSRVVGIDEVGRGAWAGPLVLAAYIFTQEGEFVEGVNDSKKISKKKRKMLSVDLKSNSSIIEVEAKRIDDMGVGVATEWAILELINKLNSPDTYFLIDGKFPSIQSVRTEIVIGGDARFYSVACASIIAKVYRDNLMCSYSVNFPQYGFEKHVGYGTEMHLKAIRSLGLTSLHRKSYKPIRAFICD
ncbi:ribonuclease HII [Candidatus Dojkabacteria bacterium]|nr:ribonuclease HII [Candidatus Dojkabacteria bacterium]